MRVGKYASGYFPRLGSGPICSVQSMAPQYEVIRSTRRSRIALYTSRQAGVTSLISAIAYDDSTASKRCQLASGGMVFPSHISEGWPSFDQSSLMVALRYIYRSQPRARSESSGWSISCPLIAMALRGLLMIAEFVAADCASRVRQLRWFY